jgi:hypothetical protein
MTVTNIPSIQASQILFDRSWSYSLFLPTDKVTASGSTIVNTQGLQFQNFSLPGSKSNQPISPLRITFDIEKNFVGSPNTSKFELFNLDLKTRSQIRPGTVVELKAGYAGLVERLFFGSIGLSAVKSARSGPDIITSMECFDGGGTIVMSRIEKSYPPGTKLYQIIQDIATLMSTSSSYNPAPIDPGSIINIPNISYPRGWAIKSTCKDLLDKICKDNGLKWSIQNNSLIIMRQNDVVNSTTAIEIGPKSGMIGMPTKNGIYFEFKSLLNPKLQPGVLVKLITSEYSYNFKTNKNDPISGHYVINVVNYKGDTYGGEWSAYCKCREIDFSELQQNSNAASGTVTQGAVVNK